MSDGTILVSGVAAVINELSHDIGTWSRNHGFQEDWELADTLEGLSRAVLDGSIDEMPNRELNAMLLIKTARVLRNNIIGTKLMLIVSECAEAMETLRDHGVSGLMEGDGNFGEELADAAIRLSDTAHMMRSPIGDEIVRKVDANNSRPYKHGRKM